MTVCGGEVVSPGLREHAARAGPSPGRSGCSRSVIGSRARRPSRLSWPLVTMATLPSVARRLATVAVEQRLVAARLGEGGRGRAVEAALEREHLVVAVAVQRRGRGAAGGLAGAPTRVAVVVVVGVGDEPVDALDHGAEDRAEGAELGVGRRDLPRERRRESAAAGRRGGGSRSGPRLTAGSGWSCCRICGTVIGASQGSRPLSASSARTAVLVGDQRRPGAITRARVPSEVPAPSTAIAAVSAANRWPSSTWSLAVDLLGDQVAEPVVDDDGGHGPARTVDRRHRRSGCRQGVEVSGNALLLRTSPEVGQLVQRCARSAPRPAARSGR